MENNKVFIVINRINAILFLLLLLAGLTGSVFIIQEFSNNSRRNAIEISTPDKESKEIIELSEVRTVYGNDIQYIRVYSKKDGVLASGGYTRSLRNLLFLNSIGNEPTWLLHDNNSKIIHNRQLTKKIDEKSITDFFYVEIVKEKESIKIGVSEPDGTNLKYIDSKINKVVEYEYFSTNKKLGILLQIGNELRYRIYDLNTFKMISDKYVVKL